jgi:hypothetical protein
MNNFKTVSNDLVKGLELQYEPVGVTRMSRLLKRI